MKLLTTVVAILLVANQQGSFAQTQKNTIEIGKINTISIKIPEQNIPTKCNIEIKLPDQKIIDKDITSPTYDTQIDVTPLNEGPFIIEWTGKFKPRGLFTVFGCNGSGKIEFTSISNNEQLKDKWGLFFSKLNQEPSTSLKKCHAHTNAYATFQSMTIDLMELAGAVLPRKVLAGQDSRSIV